MPYSFTLSNIRKEAAGLWQLAWPVLIGQLATVGMGVADVAMTGHTSAAELAAVSLGAAVWSIILVTVNGTMMAVNTVVAHQVGAGQFDRIPHTVRQSLWMGLAVGILAALAANLATLLFDHLLLPAAVNARASMFVHIISVGLLPFAAYRALYGYSASINHTKPVMVIAIVGLVINVIVNWLLIFGNLGLPKMGALGCAVASGAVVWLDLLLIVLWIRIAPAYRASYPFTRWEWPHWPEIWTMVKLGVPIGVTYFAEVSVFGAVSLLVARFGVVTVSAHQIALNFSSLTFMVPLSFGIGMIARVGQALGEGNPQRARFASFVGLGMSVGFAVLSALVIAGFRHQIAAAYTSDPAVREMCAHLLLFAALFQLSDAAQVAASCAIRGYKVTRGPMVIQLIAFWGVALPLGCVLGLAPQWLQGVLPFAPAEPMSATGFWIGLVLGLTVAAVLLTAFLQRLSRERARGT
jgi:MATE family multidrug resistance protein